MLIPMREQQYKWHERIKKKFLLNGAHVNPAALNASFIVLGLAIMSPILGSSNIKCLSLMVKNGAL